MLSGWKTYAVAAVCGLIAVGELFGFSIPGITASPGDLIIYALGLFGLRNAIK